MCNRRNKTNSNQDRSSSPEEQIELLFRELLLTWKSKNSPSKHSKESSKASKESSKASKESPELMEKSPENSELLKSSRETWSFRTEVSMVLDELGQVLDYKFAAKSSNESLEPKKMNPETRRGFLLVLAKLGWLYELSIKTSRKLSRKEESDRELIVVIMANLAQLLVKRDFVNIHRDSEVCGKSSEASMEISESMKVSPEKKSRLCRNCPVATSELENMHNNLSVVMGDIERILAAREPLKMSPVKPKPSEASCDDERLFELMGEIEQLLKSRGFDTVHKHTELSYKCSKSITEGPEPEKTSLTSLKPYRRSSCPELSQNSEVLRTWQFSLSPSFKVELKALFERSMARKESSEPNKKSPVYKE